MSKISSISLIERAVKHNEKVAIIANSTSYTYKELLDASSNIARCLLNSAKDLEEKRVAFMVSPGFDYVATQWGIWRAGGIAVPLCVSHPLPALEYVIMDADADMIVASKSFLTMLSPVAKKKKIRLLTVDEAKIPDFSVLPIISIERRAMMLYTSGTTSKPKGVVTTHKNIEAQVTSLIKAWDWRSFDHILNVLPMHHVHGIINVLTCALWSGATCEFLPKFDPTKVWDKFINGNINLFMAVPTIYHKLIAKWEDSSPEQKKQMSECCKRFRLMVSGSDALPVSVLEKWKAITGHFLLERYGMTELGMVLSNPLHGKRLPGYVGKPLPNVQVRLVNDKGDYVKEGEPGEIQVKGPNVFLEYWGKSATAKEAFKDNWFRTGDIAIIDDGNYKILGRESVDMIKSGGYKISALEIEEVLRTHPLIKECAVVGLPDTEWGEVIAAGLVIDDVKSLDLKSLREWGKQRLPAYKVPTKIIFLDKLPRNTLGKVSKSILKELF